MTDRGTKTNRTNPPNRRSSRSSNKITQIDPNLEKDFQSVEVNWIPAIVLLSTPFLAIVLVPWYAFTYGFSNATLIVFALFALWSGLGITAGYHRLWSHKTYEAHPIVRFVLLIGATLAVQNSAFEWCAGHRIHHAKVDDVYQDPYSANRGFWFSHIGWMLKKFPSGNYDFRKIKDLTADPMLRIQHDYYYYWVVVTNIVMPMAIGYMIGDMWGTLILAGLARLVMSHHSTFFINSLAHIWGTQPYTDTNTARDNGILAFFTWGEGYHNYHHIFESDYRNGVKWWQYDPTKWLIYSLSLVGLTSNLKTISNLRIQQAHLDMQFKKAQMQIDNGNDDTSNSSLEQYKKLINAEYELFSSNLEQWKKTKREAMQTKLEEKKAYALREKQLLEDKFNEKMEQHRENFEQVKANMQQSKDNMQEKLNAKLNEIDEKLQKELQAVEMRMKHQNAQLSLIIKQYQQQSKMMASF